MNAEAVGWSDGEWNSADALGIPLTDRGLQLADGLFETILVQDGQIRLLNEHLQRWQRSAAWLGMAAPPGAEVLKELISEAINRTKLNREGSAGALRLNWSRGSSSGRGIGLPSDDPDPTRHRFWLTVQPHQPSFEPVTAWVSVLEQRNPNSVLSRCKTLAYGQSIQARREAQEQGADVGLLCNTSNDLCCADSANLLVHRQGEWITPPLSSGCLPGVMRAKAVEQGMVREASLGKELNANDNVLLINSLSCRSLKAVNGMVLNPWSEPERLWQQLISG